jgi:hypothetical protein
MNSNGVENLLTGDEAAFEITSAGSGETYQHDIGLADRDDRQAVAVADHDLAIGGSAADYGAAIAAATLAQSDAYNLAFDDFSSGTGPAMTLQGTGDANAQLTAADTTEGDNLLDIQQNNQAVDGYNDLESADYDGQQKAAAQALYGMQTADADGEASALAGFAQASPSPWADYAAALAASAAVEQLSAAGAALTQAIAAADANAGQEQSQFDAAAARDDADAQAEHDQADTVALATHDEQAAQAAATDAVFANLPDLLMAPSDGPAPTVTADFNWGYEANDFSVAQTTADFEQVISEFSVGSDLLAPALLVSPSDLSFVPTAPDWGGYVTGAMPWGRIGTTIGSWTPTSNDFVGGEIRSAGGGSAFGNPVAFGLRDLARQQPLSRTYGSPDHFSGRAAELLNVNNTPSATGLGGYRQSPLPASPLSGGSGSGTATQPTSPPPVQTVSGEMAGHDPKESPSFDNRAKGEPTAAQAEPELRKPDQLAQATDGSGSTTDGTPATDEEPATSDFSPHSIMIAFITISSSPAPLQLGGDPNSPFKLPLSERARAEQNLMNLGLRLQGDPGDFSRESPALEPPHTRENGWRTPSESELYTGDYGFAWAGDRYAADNERHFWPNFFAGVPEGFVARGSHAVTDPIGYAVDAVKGTVTFVLHPGESVANMVIDLHTAPSLQASGQMVGGMVFDAALGEAVGLGLRGAIRMVNLGDSAVRPSFFNVSDVGIDLSSLPSELAGPIPESAAFFFAEDGISTVRVFLSVDDFASLPVTGRIDPSTIRFSQNTISENFGDRPTGSLELAGRLKAGEVDPSSIPEIRIVVKGQGVFTLDNRRLSAFQEAEIEIPYRRLESIPLREERKFTTTNDGVAIIILIKII